MNRQCNSLRTYAAQAAYKFTETDCKFDPVESILGLAVVYHLRCHGRRAALIDASYSPQVCILDEGIDLGPRILRLLST